MAIDAKVIVDVVNQIVTAMNDAAAADDAASAAKDAQIILLTDRVATLTTERDALLAAGAEKDAQIAALTAQIVVLNARIAELEAGGGSGDLTPDAFSFTPVTNAQPSQVYISNEITIAGINEAVVATSTVPRSKNGGAFVTTDGIAVNGDKFRLQLIASSSPNVGVSGALTIGSVSSTFLATTADVLTPADMFAQQIHRAWFQEDLAEGAVASWLSRGRDPKAAVQATVANRPVKLPTNGGVHFAKGLSKRLTWAQDNDAAYSHRWWVVIAKTDTAGATADGGVICINGNSGANTNRQPLVWFNKADNTFISSVSDGVSKALRGPVVDDGWQVLFAHRRGAVMHCYVNGVYVGNHDFLSFRVPNVSVTSVMGAVSGNMGADVWIDAAVFGDGELTDEQVECVLGWAHHRVGREDMLPAGHRFETNPPRTADMPALHSVHEHVAAEWNAFVAETNAVANSHRGELTYNETGYERVFFTDFDRADQLPASDLTGHKNSPWFSPHWNAARAESARDREATGFAPPEAYLLDTSAGGTLALRLTHNIVWKIGMMASVNNNGHGRVWGKGIFKCRIKYNPPLTPPYPGIFDGFWAYGREHITQRTRNRTEQDFMENTGKAKSWADVNLHVHDSQFLFPADPTIIVTDVSTRIGDRNLISPGFPITFDMFDGGWHEFICKVDDDLTYFYAGQNGVLYETGRCPTIDAMSMLKYLIVDRALSATHGDRHPPLTSEVIDYVIDYVEVMQRTTDLVIVPVGFSALPTISASGLTLTVIPNTIGSQIEYRYYASGVPIILAEGPNPTLNAEWSGESIRCHVKNLSVVNQPEAWSSTVVVT